MRYVMKIGHDNNVTNHKGVVYAEKNIKLPWLIGLGVNYDENLIEQLHDWAYRCGLHRKRNWTVMIN